MIKIGTPKYWKLNSKGQSVAVDYAYSDVKYDEDGWADAKKFIPADFDICRLKIKDKKTKSGWSSGKKWDGLKIKPEDEILYWKNNRE